MKDIADILREARSRPGQSFALATLVRAQGSSYRRPGARMLICEDGKTAGSLSGGCLEEEVAAAARKVLAAGVTQLMTFDTRRRFGCHGSIEIFIERIEESVLRQISTALENRTTCMVATVFATSSSVGEAASLPTHRLGSHIIEANREVNSFPYTAADAPGVLVQQIHPPIRLLICGDGPDSQPIHQFCATLGWIALDLPAAHGLTVEPDAWTAAIVKSHNYGRDFAMLKRLLPLNLRYVGLIGPRKRRDQLLNDLLDVGVPINAGFFAPAGLDLGVETPAEIALAVVSEIQHAFTGGTGVSLRERKSPIHIARSRSGTECETPVP